MEGRSRNRKKIKRAFTQLGAICEDHLLNSSLVEVDSSWLCGKKHTGKARGGEKAMKGVSSITGEDTRQTQEKKIYIYTHLSGSCERMAATDAQSAVG